MSKPFRRYVTYQFEVAHEIWEVTGSSENSIGFSETEKNGQEDTHIAGELNLIDGKWKLEEWTRESIDMYRNDETADAIEAFFDKHGPPTDSNTKK